MTGGCKIQAEEGRTSDIFQSSIRLRQYEVIVPGRGVILVGCSNKYRSINNRHTWFQNEAMPRLRDFSNWRCTGATFSSTRRRAINRSERWVTVRIAKRREATRWCAKASCPSS